jgi:menaquinone-dependent protoporphyrinogen IX oxidase
MNKKILVIYSSIHGATKQYAQWISEELKSPIVKMQDIKSINLMDYDVIVYGGALYAGGINGVSAITKNWKQLSTKQIIIFTVGLANPESTDYENIIKKAFTQEQIEKVKIFHLRGGINYKKLGLIHKVMMKMLARSVKNRPQSEMDEETKLFLETYGKEVDFTDKETIEPIVKYIYEISNCT